MIAPDQESAARSLLYRMALATTPARVARQGGGGLSAQAPGPGAPPKIPRPFSSGGSSAPFWQIGQRTMFAIFETARKFWQHGWGGGQGA